MKRTCWRLALAAVTVGLVATLISACGGDGTPSSGFTIIVSPTQSDYQGFYLLRGTITLPSELPAHKTALVGLSRTRPQALGLGDVLASGQYGAATQSIEYRIRDLAAGSNYFLFAAVDQDGDGKIGPGDWGGFYNGSADLPKVSPGEAFPISVADETVADFGIGVIPSP